MDFIYVLTCNTDNCNMQYVGQTCHKLKTRFGEHFCKIIKTKNNDTFLY